jgi:hypothetical protein
MSMGVRDRLSEATGRPIGPWSRRTAAPEASATRRDRAELNQGGTSRPVTDHLAPVGGSAGRGLVHRGFRLARML